MNAGLLRDKTLHFVWTNRLALLRIAVMLGVFMGALVAAYVANRSQSLASLALAASLGGFAALVFVRKGHYENGILGVILSAGLLNFYTLPTGTQSRIPISLVVALGVIGLWLLQVLNDRRVHLQPSPLNRPLAAFILVSLFSYVWSLVLRDPLIVPWRSFPMVQLGALTVNILLPLLALYVSNNVRDSEWLRRCTWALLVIGTLAILWNIIGLPRSGFYNNGTRGLFATWVGVLSLSLALTDQDLSRGKRLWLVSLFLAWFYWTFVRDRIWLSGWVPLVGAGMLLALLHSRKLFAVLALIAIVYFSFNFNRYYQSIVVANINEGSTERLELWSLNLQLVSRHPLFGVGPAGYAVYYVNYHPDEARSTHNNYFDVLAQTGFVGLVIFLWLMGTMLHLGNRARRLLRGRGNFEEAFANAALSGGFGALLAMMLGDWVLPFAYNQTITGFDNASYSWIFLGGVVALYHLLDSRDRPSVEAQRT